MTDSELLKLELLAKAATPGRWMKDCPSWATPWMVGVDLPFSDKPLREVICTLDVKYGNTEDAPRALEQDKDRVIADAAFIAASCPETVLEMIAEIRKLRQSSPK